MAVTRFLTDDAPAVQVSGYLHTPAGPPGLGIVLTHGAGSNCESPMLVALATEFTAAGITVLRCDLPFRQERPHGPPARQHATRDREGLKCAVLALREIVPGPVYLGGHSYGGRQASVLAASEPDLAQALLLLSYPLHAPGRSGETRTAHFPDLRTPALFVHGSRDPFGRIDELRRALELIPAECELYEVPDVRHDLGGKAFPGREIAAAFRRWVDKPIRIPVTDIFDLHSVPAREVKAVVEAYLEEARRMGFKALRIIHGRGIGVQRETVRAVLARTSFVETYGDAPAEAGGWGATVITLR